MLQTLQTLTNTPAFWAGVLACVGVILAGTALLVLADTAANWLEGDTADRRPAKPAGAPRADRTDFTAPDLGNPYRHVRPPRQLDYSLTADDRATAASAAASIQRQRRARNHHDAKHDGASLTRIYPGRRGADL